MRRAEAGLFSFLLLGFVRINLPTNIEKLARCHVAFDVTDVSVRTQARTRMYINVRRLSLGSNLF